MLNDPAQRRFCVFGTTQIGRVRRSNEDHILVGHSFESLGDLEAEISIDDGDLNDGLLLAVADGIGGEAGGAVASRLALDELARQFYSAEDRADPRAASAVLRAAAVRANGRVLEAASNEPRLARMGCTLTGICLLPETYLVFNAGDSRVYRFHKGQLERLTRDDSMANLVVEAGAMTREEAARSPIGHTLTNCVGSEDFAIAIQEGPAWQDDDQLLICSDGLYDMVSDDAIASVLASAPSPKHRALSLVDAAMTGGGHDNISILLIERQG